MDNVATKEEEEEKVVTVPSTNNEETENPAVEVESRDRWVAMVDTFDEDDANYEDEDEDEDEDVDAEKTAWNPMPAHKPDTKRMANVEL
jgi:hypothetical protein